MKKVRLYAGCIGTIPVLAVATAATAQAAVATPNNAARAVTPKAKSVKAVPNAQRISLTCYGSKEVAKKWSGASTHFWYANSGPETDTVCIGTVDGKIAPNQCNNGLEMRVIVWGMKGGRDTSLLLNRSVGGAEHGHCGSGSITYGTTIQNAFIPNNSDKYIQMCVAFWYPANSFFTAEPTCFTMHGYSY